jgi:hypothetical protein
VFPFDINIFVRPLSIKIADTCATDTESLTNTAGNSFFIYQPIITKEQIIHISELQNFSTSENNVNPLTAELNPICHLIILLGDLTFIGKCIVSISNKMQRYTVYLYLETALHVSGGSSTYHQELIQLYLQHLVFVTPLLLSDAIVEELKPV